MIRQLLACSDCEQGAADRYWWLAAAVLLVSVVLAVALLVRLRAGDLTARVLGAVALAVLLLGIGLSLSTLARGAHAFAEDVRVSCGSALTAATTRGIPTDAALDRAQLACRAAGRHQLRSGLPVALPILAIGLFSAAASIAMSRKPSVVSSLKITRDQQLTV